MNQELQLRFEGKDLEKTKRLGLYRDVISKVMSASFKDYKNNPESELHVLTPNANFGIGRLISKLLPGDEDPHFEKTLSMLAESILPEVLSKVPDINEKDDKDYTKKYHSA